MGDFASDGGECQGYQAITGPQQSPTTMSMGDFVGVDFERGDFVKF